VTPRKLNRAGNQARDDLLLAVVERMCELGRVEDARKTAGHIQSGDQLASAQVALSRPSPVPVE
jgi:hypothetical protein